MYTAEVELVTDQISECTSTYNSIQGLDTKIIIVDQTLVLSCNWCPGLISTSVYRVVPKVVFHATVAQRKMYTIVLLWFNCGETLD